MMNEFHAVPCTSRNTAPDGQNMEEDPQSQRSRLSRKRMRKPETWARSQAKDSEECR